MNLFTIGNHNKALAFKIVNIALCKALSHYGFGLFATAVHDVNWAASNGQCVDMNYTLAALIARETKSTLRH